MLKKIFFLLFITPIFLLQSFIAFSQVDEPITWSFEVVETADDEVVIKITADIEEGWSLYAQEQIDAINGPLPLQFFFDDSERYTLVDDAKSITEIKRKFDDIFELDVFYYDYTADFEQVLKLTDQTGFNLSGYVEGMACFEDRCILVYGEIDIPIMGGAIAASATDQKTAEITNETPVFVTDNPYEGLGETGNILIFFLISLMFGIIAILTPCVFPMIPMTIGFFMQGSTKRHISLIKAFIFGISIAGLYTLVGVIVTVFSAGADFTTMLSTNWIPNLIFFILFMAFAASLFGLFEFVMPSSLVNKADKQVDKGGMLASFFLALTLVIVSFSCTGPIIGALLVQATVGSSLMPTIGMLGFGIGFALPFTILAISPNWLKNLPKSGGWLNAVKVVMGFLILAFSLKFLSNIDQNYHLNLMSRDFFIAVWIVIFIVMGIYLLGKIKFAHDSDVTHLSFFRLMLAMTSFTIAVYLIPGMFGANLSTVSGLLPPITDQRFDLTGSTQPGTDADATMCSRPEHSDRLGLPFGVQAYFNHFDAFECAEILDKPVLIYFTGHSCSNCKRMQGEVWSDARVQELLNNEFVMAALYVDDRVIEMDADKWFVSRNDGRVKRRLGEANADIQIVNFNVNSQPYYVTISPDGRVLEQPVSYNNSVEEFIEFLNSSLENY